MADIPIDALVPFLDLPGLRITDIIITGSNAA
jgi:hypothetical protein